MSVRQVQLFTRSDITAVLFLVTLLLLAGAVSVYQKSTALIPPEVIVGCIESAPASSPARNVSGTSAAGEMLAARKININTAPSDSLTLLPGIGPHLADRIIRYRSEGRRFEKIDDLMLINGIGPARLDAVRNMITTGTE